MKIFIAAFSEAQEVKLMKLPILYLKHNHLNLIIVLFANFADIFPWPQ